MLQNTEYTLDINYELFEKWLAYLDVSASTLKAYSKNVSLFIRWLKDNDTTHPTRETILRYKLHLKQKECSACTVQAYIVSIRQFFNWLEDEGLYKNIGRNIKGAKVDNFYKKDYLSIEQAKELLKDMSKIKDEKGLRDLAIVSLMLTTGLRVSEVTNALVADIETLNNGVKVLFINGKGRSEKDRYVKIPNAVSEILNIYLKFRTISPNLPLFASTSNNNNGKSMTTKSISEMVKQSFCKIGLDSSRLTTHSLRRTFGVLAVSLEVDLSEISTVLGHSSIKTTEIYTKILDRTLNNTESVVSNAIFAY